MAKLLKKKKSDGLSDKALKSLADDLGASLVGEIKSLQFLSCGSFSLDMAMGGGLPIGRAIEVFGPFMSGKTILLYSAEGQAQRAGGIVHHIVTENVFDKDMYSSCGADASKSFFYYPESLEEVYDKIIEICLKVRSKLSSALCFIGWDSYAGSVEAVDTRNMDEEKKEKQQKKSNKAIGLSARVNSKLFKRVCKVVNDTDCILFYTNQARDEFDDSFAARYKAKQLTSPGGWSLKHLVSIRLFMSEGKPLVEIDKPTMKGREKAIGQRCYVEVNKNNTYPPWRKAWFDLYWGKGIDFVSGVIDFLKIDGLASVSGPMYNILDERMRQSQLIDSLADKDFRDKLIQAARVRFRPVERKNSDEKNS